MNEQTERVPEWRDKEDMWTADIEAAHPLNTEDNETYELAMRMVGNRHSKYALVDLVNWLLVKSKHAPKQSVNERLLESAKRIVGHYTAEDYAELEKLAPGHIAGEYNIGDALALRDAITAAESSVSIEREALQKIRDICAEDNSGFAGDILAICESIDLPKHEPSLEREALDALEFYADANAWEQGIASGEIVGAQDGEPFMAFSKGSDHPWLIAREVLRKAGRK